MIMDVRKHGQAESPAGVRRKSCMHTPKASDVTAESLGCDRQKPLEFEPEQSFEVLNLR